MTNEERLKEIEERANGDSAYDICPLSDRAWLINRVKVLTQALEFYADYSNYEVDNMISHEHDITCYSPMHEPITYIARKALNDTGEK